VFGELPKMFGKAFVIGYLLPAGLTIAATVLLLQALDYVQFGTILKSTFLEADEKVGAVRVALGVALIWVFGVILLAVNFQLIRTLEGYGRFNPARLWKWYSLSLFDKTTRRLTELSQRARVANLSPAEGSEQRALTRHLAEEFPERRELILPTRFGNIIRAFERYPQVIYNIEPIRLWMRLQAVIPQDYRNLLDDAKAMLDFYVNLWCGTILVALSVLAALVRACYCLVPSVSIAGSVFVIIVALIGATGAAKLAQSAAFGWGELVKGAFDLYRGELCKQLGFEMPRSIEREREMWTPICQAMLYRSPAVARQFTIFRPLPDRD